MPLVPWGCYFIFYVVAGGGGGGGSAYSDGSVVGEGDAAGLGQRRHAHGSGSLAAHLFFSLSPLLLTRWLVAK